MAAYKIYRRKKNLGGFQIFFSQKLQGYTSYKWSQSCKVTKVTIHKQIFLQGCKVMEVTRLRRAPFSNFLRNPKSCKVTKVTMSFANSEKIFLPQGCRVTEVTRLRRAPFSNS